MNSIITLEVKLHVVCDEQEAEKLKNNPVVVTGANCFTDDTRYIESAQVVDTELASLDGETCLKMLNSRYENGIAIQGKLPKSAGSDEVTLL